MSQAFTQIDAFTAEPFKGNPAAVCVLERPQEESWMQKVAQEMNLSETVFLQENGPAHYQIRWFTPVAEVDLCGHATLASAFVLFQKHPQMDEVKFDSRSGSLFARRRGDWIELDFPTMVPEPKSISPQILQALGVKAIEGSTGRTPFDDLIEVESEEVLRGMNPDFVALAKQKDSRGFIVTTRGSGDYDFLSRYFAPALGINEDPVTGSIHCALAPYWADKLGKNEMLAYQLSARGGVLKLNLKDERTLIAGQAIQTLRGEILV